MAKLAKQSTGPTPPGAGALNVQSAPTSDSNRSQLEIDKRWTLLPILAKEFGIDTLNCAMKLTGTPYPTAAQLDAVLLEMYPVGGPTAAGLVAAGWLLPAIDEKGLREREWPTPVQ